MPLPPNVPTPSRRSSRIAYQRDQRSISSSDTQPQDSTDSQSTQSSSVVTADTSSNDNGPVDSSTLADDLRESRITEEGAVGGTEEPRGPLDCAICLQPCVHPAKLPCSHIFCFLCLKGFAQQSRRCAMCRTPIPHNYLERPELVQVPEPTSLENGYQWFYEGRNGWWQYDDRTSQDLELNYQSGERLFELLIAGNIYLIDFNDMVQYRKVDPVKKRRIKRDMSLNSSRIKGIAGLRLGQPVDTPSTADPPQLAPDPEDHTSNDHNYSMIPAVSSGPSRRARIQSSILNEGGNNTVWYTDDPAVSNIDDSSRHDHLYTRREAIEQVRHPRAALDQVRNPHNSGRATYDGSAAHREMQRSRSASLEQRMVRRSAFERAADLHLGHFLGRVEDPFSYHSLVENGSGLSEIFHMLRFAMRDVRHILTDLRDQFLLWPLSVQIARCLELASLVRRLLVATDMQVLYPLFLEFSRIVQGRLQSRQHGARQDDFLLQLNNEALDKARMCMFHTARLTPDYVSRARTILQQHVPPASQTNPLPNTHQASNTSSSSQQTTSSNTSSASGNQEASARPRRQLHTSLNRVVGMVEDQTIKYALFRDMLNIRQLLNLTLIRISEETRQTSEAPSLPSRDTWRGLQRVVLSVLELYCGPVSSTTPRPSVQTEDPSRNRVVFVPEATLPRVPHARASSTASRTSFFNSGVDNAATSSNRIVPIVYGENSTSSACANQNTSFPSEVNSSSSGSSAPLSGGLPEMRPYGGGGRYENCSNNCACPYCVFGENSATNTSYQQSSSGDSSQGNVNAASHQNTSEYSNNSGSSGNFASFSASNASEYSNNSSYPFASSWSPSVSANSTNSAGYPGTNWSYELSNAVGQWTSTDLPPHSAMPASGNAREGAYLRTGNTGPIAAHPYSRDIHSDNGNTAETDSIPYGLHSYDVSSGQVNRQVGENETRVGEESTETSSTVTGHDYSTMVNPEFREAVDDYTTHHGDRNSDSSCQRTQDRQAHPMISNVDHRATDHRQTSARNQRRASVTRRVTEYLQCLVPAERNLANPLFSPNNHEAFYRNFETPHNTDESDVSAQNENEINEYIDGERDNTLEHNFETVHIGSERENERADNRGTYQTVSQSDEFVTRNEGTRMMTVNDENGAPYDDENVEYHLVSSTNDQIRNVRANNSDIFETNNVILEANNVILDANNDMGNSRIPRDHQYTTEAASHHTIEAAHNNSARENESTSDTNSRDSVAESGHHYYVNEDDNQVLLTNESCDNVQPCDNECNRRRRKSCSRPNRNDSHRIDHTNNISRWGLQASRQSNHCSYNTCDSGQCLCNTGTPSQSGNIEEVFHSIQVNQGPSNTQTQSQHPIPHCVFHETHSSYTHACPISDVNHTECQQRHDRGTYPYRGNSIDDSNTVSSRYYASANRHEGGDGRNTRNSSLSERYETGYQLPEYYFSSNAGNANNTPCENGVSSSQHCPESASSLQTQRQHFSNAQSRSGNSGSYDNFGFEDILSQTNLSFNAKVFVPKSVSNGANEVVVNQTDNETANAGSHYANSNDETFDALEDIPELPDTTYPYESDTFDSTNTYQLDDRDPLDDVENHCDSRESVESDTRLGKNNKNKHVKEEEDLNEHNYTKDKSKEHSQDEAKGGYDETDCEEDNFDLEDYDLKQDSSMDETLVNDETVIVESPVVHRNIAIRSPVTNGNVEMNGIESSTGNTSVPMNDSLTVTDHNYAATTKHTQLTRQDSEHSYACKKLKSSRKNSKTKSKQCAMPSSDAKESQMKTDNTMVNTEHAYSKHSVTVAAFDHEYAKACWSETGLVDRMNYLTLQESEDEDDEDL
uniref:E3 ubiquitin-protein ligase n=1 Tax=Cacopsylla melanoneura TaxID=428564 RepID=A0A8D9AED7_9HEMI